MNQKPKITEQIKIVDLNDLIDHLSYELLTNRLYTIVTI